MVYPYAEIPEIGDALEIVPGILWIRFPMPSKLDHVNVWAIEEEDGYAIVDTGMYLPESIGIWTHVLANRLNGRRVTRVFCTHMHGDHVGMAGWLTKTYDCSLWMSRPEYERSKAVEAATGQLPPSAYVDFYRCAGWDDEALGHYRADFGKLGSRIYPLPARCNTMGDGETVRIGAHDWQIITATGHSPQHVCLNCPELGIFISGDQVIPRISSNVSLRPEDPDADPLSDWLASLQKLEGRIPQDVLVLPSHNECFYGLHFRLNQLRQGHERGLERLTDALDTKKRAVDTFAALFTREIKTPALLRMATGESLAHLRYLVNRGHIRSEPDVHGVWWYAAA
jgi:glyoxylase-like metal-dependent hydrolase (beta-lactamase superfamily II)